MKICSRCKIEKKESEFYKSSNSIDGIRSYCKPCDTEYARKYFQRERQKIQAWIEKTPCASCDELFPHYIMEFDHTEEGLKPLRWRRSGFVSRNPTLTGLLRTMEVEKVELVCANCHKTRTWMRRQVEHAT